MLYTKLKHIESEEDFRHTLDSNTNVMVCCGRMGPMCLPVYESMKILEKNYPQVAFRDMDFDIPAAHLIRDLPECRGFMGLPFTVYFKNGKVVHATSSIQSKKQIKSILDSYFKD